MNNPRILAIDYGLSRTGIAISSAVANMALPLKTIHAKGDKIWNELDLIFRQYQPVGVIVGLPLLLNGKESAQTKLTLKFIEKFGKRYPQCWLETFDERLTSKQAEKLLQERGLNRKERAGASDETSAWIMLSCYLEKGEAKP